MSYFQGYLWYLTMGTNQLILIFIMNATKTYTFFMNIPGRLVNRQEEDFDGFDEEVFVDQDERKVEKI